MQKLNLYVIIILVVLTSCSQSGKRYKIGVSQCSEDIWREKQNAELRMGAYFHDNVELRFAAAYDSDERQVQQIDSLVATGIDLLIVAPNQVKTISPAIDRAYDKGIPVIVFERKTDSQKYTAFMSADNYEMGRTMGEYIATLLKGKGRVMEIMGLKGSSPAIERHNGFAEAISKHPGIEVVATLQGDWTEESAIKAVSNWLSANSQKPIDFVFAQNDRMAMGARKALLTSHHSPLTTKFCGIDGLPGQDGGIRLVRDSILEASYIYPTYGDRLLQLAIDILDGKAYPKERKMMSAMVTADNANVLLMQSEEMMRRTEYLDQLHEQAANYLHELDTQRAVTWLSLLGTLLLLIVIVLFYMYHLSKIRMRRERVVNTLWNLEIAPQQEPEAIKTATEEDREEEEATPASETKEVQETSKEDSMFIIRFKDVVEKRMAESDLSIEDLAAEMNLSRVQLYRKVKSFTSSSPIELLRTARLNHAYQLLLTTDLSISEIAYQVGFTAPSYFTKCFKEEYGMLPGDARK